MERVEHREAVHVLPSGLVSRKEAAAYLGRAPQTLAQWASRKVGPPVVTVEGRAFYRLSDLRRVTGAEDEAA